MPKKPKHVEEKVDELIRAGFTSSEIKNEVDVKDSYISGRRKRLKEEAAKKDEDKPADIPFELSKKSLGLMYNLMGMLGCDSMDDLTQVISDDYKTLMVEKYEYDIDNKMTVAEVFSKLKANHNLMETLQDTDKLIQLMRNLGMEDVIKIYKMVVALDYYNGSLFHFMAQYSKLYWEETKGMEIITYYGNPYLNQTEKQ